MKNPEELAQLILDEIKDGRITGPVLNKASVVAQILSMWETQIRIDQLNEDREMVLNHFSSKT